MPWLLLSALLAAEADRPLVEVVAEPSAATPPAGAVAAPRAGEVPAAPATPAAEDAQPDRRPAHDRMLSTIRAQAAMRDARKQLEKGNLDRAVALLETHLGAAGGDEAYLKELDGAYRQQVAACIRAGRPQEAQQLEERRHALGGAAEPAHAAAEPAKPKPESPAAGLFALLGKTPKKPTPAAIPKTVDYVARGKLDRDAGPKPERDPEGEALARADRHWQAREYRAALQWYETAYQANPVGGVQAVRNRYGYCLLRVVQERCEQSVAAGGNLNAGQRADLAADVRQGRALVNLEEYRKFADDQLAWLAAKGEPPAAPRAPAERSANPIPAASGAEAVRALAPIQGWQRAATANFVARFRGDPEFAAEALRRAEAGRRRAHELWFPNEPLEPWRPPCEIVLHPTRQDFAAANPSMPMSPALTQCEPRNGWVVSRRMEFAADDPNLLGAILPHEVCHAVLAGRFAGDSPPKWADEGLAVLTEPQQKQEDHLRALAASRASGRGLGCVQTMRMPGYPGQNQIQDFYAQSVGMCRFLVELGGRPKLVEFVRVGCQTLDWDGALLQVYGLRGGADLEARFGEYVGRLSGGPRALAAR